MFLNIKSNESFEKIRNFFGFINLKNALFENFNNISHE